MTLEASLVLPIFLSAVLTVMFIIKLAYTHEVIGHALTETADEIAGVSYIYAASGLEKTAYELQEGLETKGRQTGETLKRVMDSLGELNGDTLHAGTPAMPDNPMEALKGAAAFIAAGAIDDMGTELFIPLAKAAMKKYLAGGSREEADIRLKALNVVNGLDGLDFSESAFLEEDSGDIDLVVTYRVHIPVPFKIIPDIQMTQRASVKAWLNGDEGGIIHDSGDSIWNLDNFTRGDRLRAQFGGTLPKAFPVIAGFSGGTALMIKSMDLTTPYYQFSANVEEKLKGYIRELSLFKGAKRGDIEIEAKDIARKHLKLIIPDNEYESGIMEALDRSSRYALQSGVGLEIIRYQHKNTREAPAVSE